MPDASSRVTIYDVASKAGVAISTVSRVLNGSAEVSEMTRQRVQEAIEELRFQPQRIAKTLASQQTTALAVALPSATSLFYVEILKGIKDVLKNSDIDLLLCNLGSAQPSETLQRFLDRGAVDGLLLVSLPVAGDLAERLERMHAPVVLIGSRHPDVDSMWWDDAEGARSATEHLIELGHTRIGYISSHPWSYNSEPRLRGYRQALETAGLRFEPDLVVSGQTTKHAGFSEEAGAEAMARLLALDAPPTAVFCSSDVQAFGAWSHARDAGLVVPRDLSILGYDNLKISRYLDLSTVDQQMYDVGSRATRRLLERIGQRQTEVLDEKIESPLIRRGSTTAPRSAK
jgi:LacI family transcriptional regulator